MTIKRYHILLFCLLAFPMLSKAQSQFQIWAGGNLGGHLYKQDFGTGNGDLNLAGAALPAGVTSFPYSNEVCPAAGNYTIVQQINTDNCSNNKWHYISLDHRQESKGRMMFVHNTTNATQRIVYVDTINQSLCAGTVYEFSAAIINIDNSAACTSGSDAPSFFFTLEEDNGNIIASYKTPDIAASPLSVSAGGLWKYSVYGLDYTATSNLNKIIIKIQLLPSQNTSGCGNDFAIDDILFSAAGPFSSITFDSTRENVIVKGVCFQDNKTISMTGMVDAFYNNVAYQWQQSTNNGISWVDIPGANDTTFAQVFSEPDTFLFRMRSAEITNISKPGCGVVSNELRVEVDGIPTDFKISTNAPVCAGSDLQFTGEGGASYEWFGPNGFHDNISTPHIYHSVLADSGTYYAQVISFGGCRATDSVHVVIKGVRDVEAGPDTAICKGSTVQLHATDGTAFSWSPAEGLSSTTIQNPLARPDANTTYTVTVTSEDGCSNTATVQVKLLNSIAVKSVIDGAAFLCFPADTASFINKSTGEIKTALWSFDNGRSSNVFDPPPQVYSVDLNKNFYTVRLTVADSAGCADTAYRNLKVENNCYIAVPSAFSPNNDGLNDYLYPLNAYKATNLTFQVYNRTGQLVYQTKDWTQKWDGTINGEPQPAGTYVWILQYTDANEKHILLKGSTVLLR